MFKKISLTLSMLALAATMFFSAQAYADTLNLLLTDPTQSGLPGDTLSFTATVTAPGTNTGTVFLNGDSTNLDSPLQIDDSGFFNNFPFTLDPGQSYPGPSDNGLLFTIFIPTGTADSIYTGSFSILGGPDGSTLDVLDTATFEVDVTSPSTVPEPNTFLLLAIGLSGLAIAVRRKMSPETPLDMPGRGSLVSLHD